MGGILLKLVTLMITLPFSFVPSYEECVRNNFVIMFPKKLFNSYSQHRETFTQVLTAGIGNIQVFVCSDTRPSEPMRRSLQQTRDQPVTTRTDDVKSGK